MKKIYTVIVTYNGLQWIEECLKSLQNSSAHCHIVVVDNMSIDGTVEYVEEKFSEVTLLRQTTNLGFGKANNIGISYAMHSGADFVFLLNQDATVSKDCISLLLYTSINNQEYGILSPFHLTWNGEELEYYFSKFILKNISIYSDYVLHRLLKEIYEVPFVNAAGWFIPKNVLETVGGFDPIFHHYGEDNNYCQRVTYHELKIGVVPSAYIFHDSKKRKESENYLFSNAYYNSELKQFQIKFANINNAISSKDLGESLKNIQKLIIINAIKLNLKRVRGYLKKLKLFQKNIGKIQQSRRQNIDKKAHYLDI